MTLLKLRMLIAFILVSAVADLPVARAEVSELRIAIGTGFGFLPLMVMQHEKLIEKRAQVERLEISTKWLVLAGGAAQNDALLSGSIDIATSGVSTFLTLWSRVKGTSTDVRGIGAIGSMPIFLNTRNPNVKTIRDFTQADRIAVPAVKVSPQAMILQMAVAQLYGDAQYSKLDSLTVSMAQGDAMAALLSRSEITAHFANPPIQYLELEKPGIHRVLNSYDVLGGPHTFIMAWTTGKFRQENPKSYKAFIEALQEATTLINADKKKAAEIYRVVSNDKSSVDDILKILNQPGMQYSLTPQNIMKFAEFMHKIGSIKINPQSWMELFFQEAHTMNGS